MDKNSAETIRFCAACLTWIASFGGTAYLIQTFDWSPWWFAFTLATFGSIRWADKDKVETCDK